MGSDYFDIAWINFDKPILHGRREDGSTVERVLTEAERERIYEQNHRHEREKYELLRELSEAA